jgi:hypothetical protein
MSQPDSYRTNTFQYTPVDQTENIANKRRVIDVMQALVNAPVQELETVIRDSYHADGVVNVTHPINTLNTHAQFAEQLWLPLRHALPDAERRDDVVAGGRYRDGAWIGCTGHYVGTFARDWLGIPATKVMNCATVRS